MKCLRCNGTGKERKRPNLPALPCYWCEGSGVEPGMGKDTDLEEEGGPKPTSVGYGMH